MSVLNCFTKISPSEFWCHGYRTGRDHERRGIPSVLDDDDFTGEPAEPPSDERVIQMVGANLCEN